MRQNSILTEAMRPLVDLVYPPRCPLCGEGVADQGGVCAECFAGIERPAEPCCTLCMRPIGASLEEHARCLVCEAHPPRHAGVYAATLYGDATRKLILTYKHGGKIALASLLGRMMGQSLPDDETGETLLVPVPLHRWRLWRRGFNQAALLARELEKQGKGRLLVDGLVRRKQTPSLGGLGREAREKALSGAITVRSSREALIKGKAVTLVDDVLTSGATSDACTAALLDAGASSVKIACFARVVDS